MSGLRDHFWRDANGASWSLDSESDYCARCGGTPDSHRTQPPDWAFDEARQLLALLGPSYIAPYHTRKRREREIAGRLSIIVALHSSPATSDASEGEPNA